MSYRTNKNIAYSMVIVTLLILGCLDIADSLFPGKPEIGEPTKEELATAANVPYEIESMYCKRSDKEYAMATIIVPLGLSKEQIAAVCKSAVADIEKHFMREMKGVTLDLFHENTVDRSAGSFSCARYILDRRGRRGEPETLSFYPFYFTEPEEYKIKYMTQDEAVLLWHDLIRAERRYGIGTPESEEAEAKLYKAYGLDPKDENKFLMWSMVDKFDMPPATDTDD